MMSGTSPPYPLSEKHARPRTASKSLFFQKLASHLGKSSLADGSQNGYRSEIGYHLLARYYAFP
jgi:hypothetical protein